MNGEINSTINVLPPFKRLCMTIGELPASYLETMTYYETLLWLTKYLGETVIPTINNNAEAVSELQNLYIQLQDYVNNYLDNELPELIDIELDSLAENGTLENLLNNKTHLIRRYNTEIEMIENKNNLVNDMIIYTFGKNNINDGGGAKFKIVNYLPSENYINLDNGLYAIYINDILNNYIDDITVEKRRYHDTDCYITTIPLNDKYGNQINPYIGYSGEKTPTQYARDNFTTLTINASLMVRTNNGNKVPSIISNGIIINNNNLINQGVANNILYLGIKADRTIEEYPVYNTTAEYMIEDGVIQAFDVYWKLVENGNLVDLSDFYTNEGLQANDVRGPRQTLGVKSDGTIIILTCDGRTQTNLGLLSSEQQEIMIELGCVNAWNLDGGGSTSTTYLGEKVNRNIDNHGTSDRQIPYTLNFKSQTVNKETAKIYSQIGKTKQEIIEQMLPDTTENKVRSMIVLNGRALADEESINDFYFPDLGRIIGSENSNDLIELVKKNEEDSYYTYFKIKKTGYFLVTSNLELITRAIQNNRINLYRVNQDYEIPGSEIGNSSTLATAQRVEITNMGFINNRNVNNIYALRISTQSTSNMDGGAIFIQEM